MKVSKMRVLSLILALVMIVGSVPFNAFAAVDYDETVDDYYNVISKTDYELAPGITESEIVLNNDAGSHRQVAHVVEVDIDNPYTKVIPSYKGMAEALEAKNYGVQIMSQQAAYAEANGYGNVVAAMNLSLSWYDNAYYTEHPELVGEPLGYMILDGVQYTNSKGQTAGAQTCLVINFDEKDGVARPADIPKTEIRSTSSAITGWEEQVIPANFGFLVKDGVNQYSKDHTSDPASRSFVGIKADGTIVIVMNDGRQSPYSAGFNNYEMAQFMISLGCVQAVNGDGGGSSAFLSQRPGEDLKVNCAPSDGAERPTTHGILVISTAPATGEFVRAQITAEDKYYTPGSTVKFSAIGTDLVGTVADIPADATWQLADSSMGTIKDGVFVSNGKVGTATAQLVWKGKVVGSASVEIVIPTEFSFAQAVMTVPFDKEVTIGINATINDGMNTVVIKPEDVEFTTTNSALGTFDGLKFTSVSEKNAPADLTSTLTATFVHNTDLVATASLTLGKGSEILFDFEDSADIAEWNTADVNNHNKGFYHNLTFANASNGQVHHGSGSMRVELNPIAAEGVHSGGWGQEALYLDHGVVIENATSIGFWAYISDEYVHCVIRMMYWYDSNNDGKFDKKNTVYVMQQPEVYNTYDESGWKYFSVDVSAYDKILIPGLDSKTNFGYNAGVSEASNYRFIEISFPHTNTNDLWKTYGTVNGLQTVYIDEITADYSDAVDDRDAPVFSKVELAANDNPVELKKHATATTKSNLLTISATVSENTAKTNATGLNTATAKAYIDGVNVPVTFANGRMTISDVAVANGTHRVKFEICDNMGNKSVVVRLVKVDCDVDASTVQVVPADPALNNLYGGSIYWMNVNANEIETIQSVKAVIDLNYGNHFELDHMVLADGFTATYTIDEENNTATIVITRTGKNTQSGAATLASLPIRVIYYDTDIKMDGYTAETYWNTYKFWPFDLKVDVDMGEITYVDGYTSDVLGAFSNEEFSVDTELQAAFSDSAFKAERGTCHVHTPEAVADKAATCTESGYTGRTFCAVCNSVVEWGTTESATGHDYQMVDGVLKCVNSCGQLFNGELEGKTYIDGVVVNGWIDNTYYYIDGVMVTGQYYMDGKLYTFGADGVYDADYLYTGFYETADGKLMYFVSNEFLTGYQYLMGNPYFFDANGYGFEGEYTMAGETCLFENGQYVSCSTANVLNAGMAGTNATYVLYADGTFKLDGTGATYSFTNHGTRPFISYTYKIKTLEIGAGITRIGSYFMCYSSVASIKFAEGSNLQQIGTAAFYEDYALRTIELPGSVTYLSNIAFGKCENLAKVVLTANVSNINAKAFNKSPNVTLYVVDGSYAMEYAVANRIPYVTYVPETVREIVEVDGALYYYEDGVKTYGGLIYLNDAYYYVRSSGQIVVNRTYWVTKTNDLLPEGNYTFGSDGKMIAPPTDPETPEEPETPEITIPEATGTIVNEGGTLYYHENGVRKYAGLIYLNGALYYVRSNGALAISRTYWVTKTNDLVEAGNYQFDAEGKMINPPIELPETPEEPEVTIPEATGTIVNEGGTLYYHENGARKYAGLIYLDGNYYYVRSSGALVVGRTYWVTKTNDLLPAANYTFGADGKMIVE